MNARWRVQPRVLRRIAYSAIFATGLLLVCGRSALSRAADLLGDRDGLEQSVRTVVLPFLQESPAAVLGETGERGEDSTAGDAKPKSVAQNGRAWAIVVGIVSKQGRHVFGHGRVAAESSQQPDDRTLFEIGSVTKTFTALLLADAAERGKVKLDDPVRLYLPESATMPKRGDKEITLLHLATHTSGLPRIPLSIGVTAIFSTNPYKNYDANDLLKTLAGLSLTRDPGEQYEYSNLAYGLLGHALSRQAGCSFEDLAVKRICKPLALRDTRVNLDEDQRKRFAPPYTASATAASNWDFGVLAGAGALRSTADDMLTYIEANMGIKKSDLLPAMRRCHTVRHSTRNKIQSIGLGWHVEKRTQGAQLVFHGGGTGGYSSLVGFIEENGQPTVGLVILANAAPAATGGSVANDVAVKLLDLLRDKSE